MNITNIKLGIAANALNGFDATWMSEHKGNNALFPVMEKPMLEMDIEMDAKKGEWQYPVITLHDDAMSMLDELLPYTFTEPAQGLTEVSFSSAALLLGHNTRQKDIVTLSKTLGVDLTNSDSRFALVMLKREDSTVSHPSVHMDTLVHPNPITIPDECGIQKSFMSTMAKLKRVRADSFDAIPDNITLDEANAYLNMMNKTGTHFVSKITLGDIIFQVFAMPKDRYERVKKYYAHRQELLQGYGAVLFRQYTTSTDDNFGYVKEYGHIVCLSNDENVKESLSNGDWNDDRFAEQNSIFMPFTGESALTPNGMNGSFTSVTACLTELSSLTLFLEYGYKLVWKRVLQAGLVHRYGNQLKFKFYPYYDFDPSQYVMRDDIPGFLSNIATPYISTYKIINDMTNIHFVGPEIVKETTMCGSYAFFTENNAVMIPGNDVLMAFQVASFENNQQVPVMRFTDAAYDKVMISCKRFYGPLILENAETGAARSVTDGIAYVDVTSPDEMMPGGRVYMKAISDIRMTAKNIASDRLKSALMYHFSFAESAAAAFNPEIDGGYKDFIIEGLEWLTALIPPDTDDMDLMNLRVRALDLARITADDTLGAYVPVLPAEVYEKQTGAILDCIKEIEGRMSAFSEDIERRKQNELNISIGKTLNENIIKSGKLIADYIEAGIKQQRTLSAHYETIIKQKHVELNDMQNTTEKLRLALIADERQIEIAINAYTDALEKWKITREIEFALSICTDIFNLGATILIPASAIKTVESLGRSAQNIQKLLNAANATYKLYAGISTGKAALENAQKVLDTLDNGIWAAIAWDELSIDMNDILSGGPNDPVVNAKKSALVAAFSKYVLKGKAHVSALSSTQSIAREIYNNTVQKKMIDDNVANLSALNTKLQPKTIEELEVDKIDLVGLTGMLNMLRSQMLGLLVKSFNLQDQALMYTWLQKSTPLRSFDMIGVKEALVDQIGKTNNARENMARILPSETRPIQIEVEIPALSLLQGNAYQFDLAMDVPEFARYVNLRILSLAAKVEGVKCTDSKDYLLTLTYGGRPFYDRNFERNPLIFNTPDRTATYEYEVEGNKPKFTDNGKAWSEGVNMLTPFTRWTVSMPSVKTNKGLQFDGAIVKLILTFVLKVRIFDEDKQAFRQLDTNQSGIESVLMEMKQGSVVNGWDVVFNMSTDGINAALKEQYETLCRQKSYANHISVDAMIQGAEGPPGVTNYTLRKFDFTYGYPLLDFLKNGTNAANLEMIISSGTTQLGSCYMGDVNEQIRAKLEALAVAFGVDPKCITEEVYKGKKKLILRILDPQEQSLKEGKMNALINLNTVVGLVENNKDIHSVVLNMQESTFSVKHIELELESEFIIELSNAIKEYFVSHPVQYIINSLNLKMIPTLADLKPNQFLFKAMRTAAGTTMLQLFIATNDRPAQNPSLTFLNNLAEPIPLGYSCSLIISSKIMFNSLLNTSVGTDWVIVGEPPVAPKTLWLATLQSGKISMNLDMSPLNHTRRIGKKFPQVSDLYYSPKNGNPVIWGVEGMKFEPSDTNNIKFSLSSSKIFTYTIKKYKRNTKETMYYDVNSDFSLRIDGTLTLAVIGEGRNQMIKLSILNNLVSVDAATSGGGECGSDSDQNIVNRQVKNDIPPIIRAKLDGLSFDAVSLFALKNLLFPENNYINMEHAYVPGDMLIIGKFGK